jgi:hypothetical protein
MAWPSQADRIVERGKWGSVEYAVRANGSMEAKEWFGSQDVSVRTSFGVLFKRILQEGRITNELQCRQLRDTIWEFKRGGNRLLFGQVGNRRLLTHHIKKGGPKKCPPREINRAQTIIDEHVEQEARQKKKP